MLNLRRTDRSLSTPMPPRALFTRLPSVLVLLAGLVPSFLPAAASAQGGRPAEEREVTVANETDRTLQQLYVWRTGTPGPGDDRLGANVLPPRASLRVPLGRSTNCNWEVRAVFDEGDEMRRRVDVCRAPRTTLADTGPRREVEVANDTDIELRELYLFPPGASDQGRDRLGTSVIPAGDSFRLRMRGDGTRDCVWDARAVFADESEQRRQRLDLCRAPRVAFGDPDLPVREVPVLNRARRTLRELYAAPAAPEGPIPAGRAWGPDRLGSAVVSPRESFRLRVRGRDCAFDLRGVYDDDQEEVQRGIDLCVVQGAVFGERGVADAQPRRVTLQNRHARTIQQAFLSPTESRDWGDDVLGAGTLAVGAEIVAQAVSGCRADLRIVFDTGAAEERREIDICASTAIALRPGWTVDAAPGATPAAPAPATPAAPVPAAPVPAAAVAPAPSAASAVPGPPRPAIAIAGRGRLRNGGTLPIVELYADSPGAAVRGPDRLGSGVLGAGESLDLAPPDAAPGGQPCPTDLVAVFRDGREVTLSGRDLCAGEEIVLP